MRLSKKSTIFALLAINFVKDAQTYFDYGDASVELLFQTLYGRLRLYAVRLTGDIPVAEDMLQEVFFKFIDRRAPLPERAVPAYIFTMLRNECISYIRREKVARNRISLDDDTKRHMLEVLLQTDMHMEGGDPVPVHARVLEDILEFSSQLPSRTKEIFKMSRIEQLSNNEIADMLGISVKAIEKHITISIRKFRKAFPEK